MTHCSISTEVDVGEHREGEVRAQQLVFQDLILARAFVVYPPMVCSAYDYRRLDEVERAQPRRDLLKDSELPLSHLGSRPQLETAYQLPSPSFRRRAPADHIYLLPQPCLMSPVGGDSVFPMMQIIAIQSEMVQPQIWGIVLVIGQGCLPNVRTDREIDVRPQAGTSGEGKGGSDSGEGESGTLIDEEGDEHE
jgi:hypothetical protein